MKLNFTLTFVIINVVFFIVALILGVFSTSDCSQSLCRYLALQPNLFFNNFYFWTLLTSMFMHGGLGHLFVNMFALVSLGSFCERIIGRKRFFWFYLISGIIAGLFFITLAAFLGGVAERLVGNANTFAVGASGAIFAIAGLFVVLIPRARFSIIFFPFFSLPAYVMIPAVLVLTWVVSFYSGIGIGNTAHLGGFLCGVIYGLYLRRRYPRKVNMISQMFQ